MTVQLPPVQAALTGSVALVALAGQNISQGIAPEDQTRPYVVWFIDTATPENTLSEPPEIDDQGVRVDFYSRLPSEATRMMQAGVDACEPIGTITFGPVYSYEPETMLHRWMFLIDVWNPR